MGGRRFDSLLLRPSCGRLLLRGSEMRGHAATPGGFLVRVGTHCDACGIGGWAFRPLKLGPCTHPRACLWARALEQPRARPHLAHKAGLAISETFEAGYTSTAKATCQWRP